MSLVPVNTTMQIDLGNTTFDLQATVFTELFEAIRNSHTGPYREERDLLDEAWEQEDISSTHQTP